MDARRISVPSLLFLVALHAPAWSQCTNSVDSTLCVPLLTHAQATAFSATDGHLSWFWSALSSEATDSAVLVAPDYCWEHRCDFSGPQDASMRVRAAYGDSGLYVWMLVRDDEWVAPADSGDWGADRIDVYLDTMSSENLWNWFVLESSIGYVTVPLSYSSKLLGVYLASDTDGVPAQVQYYDSSAWSWTFRSLDEVQLGSEFGVVYELLVLSDTTYELELFMPWTWFVSGTENSIPAGSRMAFTFGYNDKDGGDVDPSCLRWLGKDPWAGDANYWGDLLLATDSTLSARRHGAFPTAMADARGAQPPPDFAARVYDLQGREMGGVGGVAGVTVLLGRRHGGSRIRMLQAKTGRSTLHQTGQ